MFPKRFSNSLFLSTLSLRRATRGGVACYLDNIDFYPRSPCGERHLDNIEITQAKRISIHALLAESDKRQPGYLFLIHNFYPRSPCGERRGCLKLLAMFIQISIHALLAESDCITITITCIVLRFLSTLSLRRATYGFFEGVLVLRNFYPRSPCGERPPRAESCYLDNIISIHALLAESDYLVRGQHPSWEISIHALLAESDAP